MNSKHKCCFVFVDKEFANGVRKCLKSSPVDIVPAVMGNREGQIVLVPSDDEIDKLINWGKSCKSTVIEEAVLAGIKGTTIEVRTIALKKKGVKYAKP